MREAEEWEEGSEVTYLHCMLVLNDIHCSQFNASHMSYEHIRVDLATVRQA